MSSSEGLFFDQFKDAYVGETLLSSFNNLLDLLIWENDNADKVLEFSMNFKSTGLQNAINDIYANKRSAYDVKEKYCVCASEIEAPELSRDEIIALYKAAPKSIQPYIAFLFMSPLKIYEAYAKEYAKVDLFGEDVFRIFISEKLTHEDIFEDALVGEFSLIDYITNPNIIANIETKLNVQDVASFEQFKAQLDILTNYTKVCGNGRVVSFSEAFAVMSKVAPHWDQLNMSSITQDENENAMMGGAAANEDSDISRVVSVYSGNYSAVPKDYPRAGRNANGLIGNFFNFNKLSNDRQLQVSQYLMDNRKKFNDSLVDSARIIMNRFDDDIQEVDESTLDETTGRNFKVLKAAYLPIKQSGSMKRAVGFLCRAYVPLMNKYNFEKKGKGGFAGAVSVMNAETIEPEADLDEMEGGKRTDIKVNISSTSYSTKAYMKDLKNLQIKFNNEFVSLYRETTSELNKVDLGNVYKQTFEKLYEVIPLMNDIMIRDQKTTSELSGISEEDNKNSAYVNALKGTIKAFKSLEGATFNGVSRVLEKMVSLLQNTAKSAVQLRMKYLSSKKARGDKYVMVKPDISANESDKLSMRDIHDYEAAVDRLYSQLRNSRIESNILNNKDELKSYMNSLKSRTDYINEKYHLKILSIQQRTANAINNVKDPRLPQTYLTFHKKWLEEKRKAEIYINTVVDTYFTEDKIRQDFLEPFSDKQIKDIEREINTFKQNAIDKNDYADKMKALRDAIRSGEDMFRVFDTFKAIFKDSGYLNFVQNIYRIMGIKTDFKWSDFNNQISNYVLLSSFQLEKLYLLPKINTNSTSPKYVYQTILNWCFDFVASVLAEKDKMTSVSSLSTKIKDIEQSDSWIGYSDGFSSVFDLNIGSTAPWAANTNMFKTTIIGKLSTIDTQATDIAKFIREHFKKVGVSYASDDPANANYNNIASISESAKRFIEPLSTSMGLTASFIENSDDKLITESILESIFLKVLNGIDKYMDIRFEGNRNAIPMKFDQLMKGGSVFDVASFYSKEDVSVIPDAVPFYLCALDVCRFYFEVLSEKNYVSANADFTQTFKISKLSPIYPLTENLIPDAATHKIDIKGLTMEQFEKCINVFNKIWDRAPRVRREEKLSSAIDILLAEINSGIIFGNKLITDSITNDKEPLEAAESAIIEDCQAILNTVSEMLKQRITDYNNGAGNSSRNEKISFERALNNVYQKILSTPADQRMYRLRELLTQDSEKTSVVDEEFYKFAELCIVPLLVCYQSYLNVFQIFNSFVINFRKQAITMTPIDLRNNNIWRDYVEKAREISTKPAEIATLLRLAEFQYYNSLLLYNMIINAINNPGMFEAPVLWNPYDPTTAPKEYILEPLKARPRTLGLMSSALFIREIFPNIGYSASVLDCLRRLLQEFSMDVDKVSHLLLSYPYVSEHYRKQIYDKITNQLGFAINGVSIANVINKWEKHVSDNMPLKKSKTEVCPPQKRESLHFKSLNGQPLNIYINDDFTVEYDDLEFVGIKTPVPRHLKQKFIQMPKLSDTIKSLSSTTFDNTAIDIVPTERKTVYNTWTDYILYILARNSTTNPHISQKLLELLQNNEILNGLTSIVFEANPKNRKVNYITYYEGNVLNPMTISIIFNTLAIASNPGFVDMTQLEIDKDVAVLPYLINKLSAVKEELEVDVKYDMFGETHFSIYEEVSQLMKVLIDYYNELSTHVSKLSFLATHANDATHVMGEIINYLALSDEDSPNFIPFEWANKYAFGHLEEISFPEFKNFDKFEWIHEFAANVLEHNVFRENFEATIESMGRQMWLSFIGNTALKHERDVGNFKVLTKKAIDKTMEIINKMLARGYTTKEQIDEVLRYIAHNITTTKPISINKNILLGGSDPDFTKIMSGINISSPTSFKAVSASFDPSAPPVVAPTAGDFYKTEVIRNLYKGPKWTKQNPLADTMKNVFGTLSPNSADFSTIPDFDSTKSGIVSIAEYIQTLLPKTFKYWKEHYGEIVGTYIFEDATVNKNIWTNICLAGSTKLNLAGEDPVITEYVNGKVIQRQALSSYSAEIQKLVTYVASQDVSQAYQDATGAQQNRPCVVWFSSAFIQTVLSEVENAFPATFQNKSNTNLTQSIRSLPANTPWLVPVECYMNIQCFVKNRNSTAWQITAVKGSSTLSLSDEVDAINRTTNIYPLIEKNKAVDIVKSFQDTDIRQADVNLDTTFAIYYFNDIYSSDLAKFYQVFCKYAAEHIHTVADYQTLRYFLPSFEPTCSAYLLKNALVDMMDYLKKTWGGYVLYDQVYNTLVTTENKILSYNKSSSFLNRVKGAVLSNNLDAQSTQKCLEDLVSSFNGKAVIGFAKITMILTRNFKNYKAQIMDEDLIKSLLQETNLYRTDRSGLNQSLIDTNNSYNYDISDGTKTFDLSANQISGLFNNVLEVKNDAIFDINYYLSPNVSTDMNKFDSALAVPTAPASGFDETIFTGGHQALPFLENYIHAGSLVSGTPLMRLSVLYPKGTMTWDVYQRICPTNTGSDYKDIATAVLEYFGKVDIRNSSVMDKLRFYSLFQNHILYSMILQKIKDASADFLNGRNIPASSDHNNYYRLVFIYISKLSTTFNTTRIPFTITNVFTNFATLFPQLPKADLKDLEIPKYLKDSRNITDVNIALTDPINEKFVSYDRSFIRTLYNSIFDRKHDKTDPMKLKRIDKKMENLEVVKLINTPYFAFMRKLGLHCNIISVLIAWMRLTNYYDDTKGESVDYFDNKPILPFDAV